MDEINVETPHGTISARPAKDSEYPGIYVSIDNNEFVLVEFDQLKDARVIHVWDKDNLWNDPVYQQEIKE